jgi:hypothetical protein
MMNDKFQPQTCGARSILGVLGISASALIG